MLTGFRRRRGVHLAARRWRRCGARGGGGARIGGAAGRGDRGDSRCVCVCVCLCVCGARARARLCVISLGARARARGVWPAPCAFNVVVEPRNGQQDAAARERSRRIANAAPPHFHTTAEAVAARAMHQAAASRRSGGPTACPPPTTIRRASRSGGSRATRSAPRWPRPPPMLRTARSPCSSSLTTSSAARGRPTREARAAAAWRRRPPIGAGATQVWPGLARSEGAADRPSCARAARRFSFSTSAARPSCDDRRRCRSRSKIYDVVDHRVRVLLGQPA